LCVLTVTSLLIIDINFVIYVAINTCKYLNVLCLTG
jgi:hypothetical protein